MQPRSRLNRRSEHARDSESVRCRVRNCSKSNRSFRLTTTHIPGFLHVRFGTFYIPNISPPFVTHNLHLSLLWTKRHPLLHTASSQSIAFILKCIQHGRYYQQRKRQWRVVTKWMWRRPERNRLVNETSHPRYFEPGGNQSQTWSQHIALHVSSTYVGHRAVFKYIGCSDFGMHS